MLPMSLRRNRVFLLGNRHDANSCAAPRRPADLLSILLFAQDVENANRQLPSPSWPAGGNLKGVARMCKIYKH
ncbi:hypothetical protein KPH14_008532 [Odynerus spinipes]|uniref:Uncharacterized protein n=1 Tax=Odynerus spinipes TaxID=1348599 RepID=A0AAD9VS45_9HYME|nr:hypothetical protein KPH14_008532 [Odynerus spinipes]